MGWDSAVGIATPYGLDGPGVESRWGEIFRTRPDLPHPASYTMGTGSFPGGKAAGAWADHPPPSSAEVKERVELYLYSPYAPSWPVLGCTLTFYLCSSTVFLNLWDRGLVNSFCIRRGPGPNK
jgi:hypothetical protein